jgi:hypothetical protein
MKRSIAKDRDQFDEIDKGIKHLSDLWTDWMILNDRRRWLDRGENKNRFNRIDKILKHIPDIFELHDKRISKISKLLLFQSIVTFISVTILLLLLLLK